MFFPRLCCKSLVKLITKLINLPLRTQTQHLGKPYQLWCVSPGMFGNTGPDHFIRPLRCERPTPLQRLACRPSIAAWLWLESWSERGGGASRAARFRLARVIVAAHYVGNVPRRRCGPGVGAPPWEHQVAMCIPVSLTEVRVLPPPSPPLLSPAGE